MTFEFLIFNAFMKNNLNAFSKNQLLYAFHLLIAGALCFLLLIGSTAVQAQPFQLRSPDATLNIESNGDFKLRPTQVGLPELTSENRDWWSVLMWLPDPRGFLGKTVEVKAGQQAPRYQSLPNNGLRITYAELKQGDNQFKVDLTIDITVVDGAFQLSGSVKNRETNWVVRSVKLPDWQGLTPGPDAPELFWPVGLGQRFVDLKTFGSRGFSYPSGSGTMPWFSLTSAKGGFYIGSHDTVRAAKRINANYDSGKKSISFFFQQHPFCKPGEEFMLAPVIVKSYTGDWHVAAHFYRSWFDKQIKPVPIPDWVRLNSGWLLTILKQQNGDVMWDYPSLDKLADVADAWNLDVIGLFGWAHGGHDYLYPNYIPDPLMGGTAALKDGISKAHKKGKRIVLYANGQLIDSGTEYYRYVGNEVMAINEHQSPYTNAIRKFHSATPVTFVIACNAAEGWRKKMLELAEQANALGADGILYDQLGVQGPIMCFDTTHLHKSPATAYTTGRYEMLKDIADHMRKINPEFIVMSEGFFDGLRESIAYNHGWGEGYNFSNPFTAENEDASDLVSLMKNRVAYPELFRYTFPEVVSTQRHATPMQDRITANFAALYALRHELESRYRADVRYLLQDSIPASNAYADPAYYTPDVPMMQQTVPKVAREYMHQLIDFERKFSSLLWEGKFMDTDGFSLESGQVLAKSYQQGNRLGILIWNFTEKSQTASLKVPGYMLKEAQEPEAGKVSASQPIPPQSVRLMVFEKSSK